jgi:hypothetical protein
VMYDFTAHRRSPLGLLPGQTMAAPELHSPLTACASPSRAKKGGLGVPSGGPKTVKEPCQMARKSLQSQRLWPRLDQGVFTLGRPAWSFRQVWLNNRGGVDQYGAHIRRGIAGR